MPTDVLKPCSAGALTILGVDPSLTATGLYAARFSRGQSWRFLDAHVKKSGKQDTPAGTARRIARTVAVVGDFCQWYKPDLIVMEGPSHGSRGGQPHERGGLWWSIAHLSNLHAHGALAVIPPKTLKKAFAGHGNADKAAMRHAAHAHGLLIPDSYDDNAVDACALTHVTGWHYRGQIDVPGGTFPEWGGDPWQAA